MAICSICAVNVLAFCCLVFALCTLFKPPDDQGAVYSFKNLPLPLFSTDQWLLEENGAPVDSPLLPLCQQPGMLSYSVLIPPSQGKKNMNPQIQFKHSPRILTLAILREVTSFAVLQSFGYKASLSQAPFLFLENGGSDSHLFLTV